jgi:hypothetical protein
MGQTLPWRVALVVWLPILVIAAIYGGTYGVLYQIARHTSSRHQVEYAACQANYITLQNIASSKRKISPGPFGQIVSDDSNADKAAEEAGPCQQPGTINHGLLGLPSFCCDAYK